MAMVRMMGKGKGLEKLVSEIKQSDPRYLVTKLTLCLAKLQSVTKWSIKEIFDRVAQFIEMLDEVPDAVSDLNAGEEEGFSKKAIARIQSRSVEPAPLIVLKVPEKKVQKKAVLKKEKKAAPPKKPLSGKTKPRKEEKTVSSYDRKTVLITLQLLHLEELTDRGFPISKISAKAGPKVQAVLPVLRQLRQEGLVRLLGAGRWALTNKGVTAH